MTTDVETREKKLNIIGIITLTVVYAITVVFNSLAGALGGKIGLFNSSVGNLSDKYDTDITPAGWTFSIWSLIYIWLSICFIFYLVTLCVRDSYGGKLYLNPEVVTPVYLAVFTLNLACNTAWIFLWDRELLIASSVFLFLIAITNVLSLAILSKNLADNRYHLKEEKPKLYWTYVVLAQNGPAIYTTWTIIASLLNLVHALHYSGGVEMRTCTDLSLSLLLIVVVAWSVLENSLLDKYVRLIVTPFFVVIWASVGIISAKDDDPDVPDHTKDYVKGILGLACIFFVVKVGFLAFRQSRKPL